MIDYEFVSKYISMLNPARRMNFINRALRYAEDREKAKSKEAENPVACSLCHDTGCVHVMYRKRGALTVYEAKRASCVCESAILEDDMIKLDKIMEISDRLFCIECLKLFKIEGDVDLYSIPSRDPSRFKVVCQDCHIERSGMNDEMLGLIQKYLLEKEKLEKLEAVPKVPTADDLMKKFLEKG
jgi:hypothetical protein